MTEQEETAAVGLQQPSRRVQAVVKVGIPALLIVAAGAGILVATNQLSAEPATVATSQAPAATPSTTTATPAPKPTATKKPVAAKPKAKPAPKSTPATPEAGGAGTPQSQPGTGTSEGQIPQAAAPAQGSGGGLGNSNSSGGGWVPAPMAPVPAAPVPKPAAPRPAPVPAPALEPPVQENHYAAQTLGSIGGARAGLGAPPFVAYTAGCVPVATAWGSSLDGAEGYVQHPEVVGFRQAGMRIAGTFALDGQVNGRSGTLTVYSCPTSP